MILKLHVSFVDILCGINEEYTQYVRYERGQKLLYLRVLREIYGCIESALQWHNLYTKTLKTEGYKLNEYEKCVSNKTINVKQYNVVWYVDYNKDSHVESKVVENLL